MHLAVAPDDPPCRIDEHGGVEAAHAAALFDQLGVSEIESHTEARRLLEQRARVGAGHLALEESVDLRLILQPPARKEGGERKLGEDNEPRATSMRLAQQRDQAADDCAARFVTRDRAGLRAGDGQGAGHAELLLARRAECMRRAAIR